MSGLTAICRFHLPCVTTTFSSTQPASSLTQHGQHRTLHQHLPHSSKPWLPSHHIVLPQEALNSSLFSLPPHCSGLPLLPEPLWLDLASLLLHFSPAMLKTFSTVWTDFLHSYLPSSPFLFYPPTHTCKREQKSLFFFLFSKSHFSIAI